MNRIGTLARSLPATMIRGIGILAAIALSGWIVPLLSPYGTTEDTGGSPRAPSLTHLFGTDRPRPRSSSPARSPPPSSTSA